MGKITLVGLGPGSEEEMTLRSQKAIKEADVIVGYQTYLTLLRPMLDEGRKEIIQTGMMQEIERCQKAITCAVQGRNVVVVSSGDPGIYGMAGLVLELLLALPKEQRPQYGGVVAGVSAVNAAAARLGAPLMHDFACISLSNLLTSWEKIVKRVKAAAEADFVLALYNPRSKKRAHLIDEVQEIVLSVRSSDTPVGIVTNAGRTGENYVISTLRDFTKEEINMFSIVIIGNSETYVKEGFMITPRGYAYKKERK